MSGIADIGVVVSSMFSSPEKFVGKASDQRVSCYVGIWSSTLERKKRMRSKGHPKSLQEPGMKELANMSHFY